MKSLGGHFAPKLGGHFELESGGHFKLELGGQYHWNLHLYNLMFCFTSLSKSYNCKSLSDFNIVQEFSNIK